MTGASMTPEPRQVLESMAAVRGPLNGVVVLELDGAEPSKSFGTQILSDLGATVIILERSPVAPWPKRNSDSEYPLSPREAFHWGLHRNKLSMAVDLKSPHGQEILHGLVQHADVVYDNYRTGVLDRLGADFETLSSINPEIISCSVNGFGSTGPRANDPSYDVVIQALGGAMSLTGEGEGRPPVRFGNPVGGMGGAFYAVVGIISALRERGRKRKRLEISLLDAQLAMHSYRVPQVFDLGMEFKPQSRRGGSGALPYGPFKTKDGEWFVLAITPQFWGPFCELVGKPEWRDHDHFRTQELRQTNEDLLNRELEILMATRTTEEWEHDFLSARVPGAPVRSIRDAYDHPHVAIRDMLAGFEHDGEPEALKVAGDPIKLSARPTQPFRGAPKPGQDTDLILGQVLEYSSPQIDDLHRQGVIDNPDRSESSAQRAADGRDRAS